MAKLYTKTGDDGTTGLFDGSRVRKHDARVCAYGEVDELNARIGVAIASIGSLQREPAWKLLQERLSLIQSELFTLGAELATPETAGASQQTRIPRVTAEQCGRLETWIDDASGAVAPLRSFVLPGGTIMSAQLHVCRTVCRRAERTVVQLAGGVAVNPQLVIYLNRLSDLFFAWARQANHLCGVADVPWVKPTA